MLFGFYFFSFDQVLLLGKDFSSLSYMLLLMKIYVFFFSDQKNELWKIEKSWTMADIRSP